MGWDVKISPVAIAQGNLQMVVKETPQVSQPAPFSLGVTTGVPRTQVKAKEEIKKINHDKRRKFKGTGGWIKCNWGIPTGHDINFKDT